MINQKQFNILSNIFWKYRNMHINYRYVGEDIELKKKFDESILELDEEFNTNLKSLVRKKK